jgi:hypothetical protein
MENASRRLNRISAYLDVLGLNHHFARFNPAYLPAFVLQFESVKILVVNTNCGQVTRLESCHNRALFEYVMTDMVSTAILTGHEEPDRDEMKELLEYKSILLGRLLAHV